MAAANDTGASRASRRHRTRDDAPPVSPSGVETASEASWRGEHEGGERRGSDGRASEEDDWSPRADDPLNSTRRKLEETFVSPDESERGSRRSRGSREIPRVGFLSQRVVRPRERRDGGLLPARDPA